MRYSQNTINYKPYQSSVSSSYSCENNVFALIAKHACVPFIFSSCLILSIGLQFNALKIDRKVTTAPTVSLPDTDINY
jgi:hypothetical protein